jgi:hypothetical protein
VECWNKAIRRPNSSVHVHADAAQGFRTRPAAFQRQPDGLGDLPVRTEGELGVGLQVAGGQDVLTVAADAVVGASFTFSVMPKAGRTPTRRCDRRQQPDQKNPSFFGE